MNVEIRAEAALFPEKEYIKGIFVAVQQAVKAPCGLISRLILDLWFFESQCHHKRQEGGCKEIQV
jgi:hypothetical protein